ncbi:GlsB/YeaQ/YmgE family stress response membrane protein [Histidinibacterium aquaticum]|uniref:GlsB/YeaQ/YmgE family stress response membrane protein n=1 Tax=Histidinibacterium aquaticum TaxID=2613962 RepID=A0A5J5GCP6_9RHOB|nr:GlsB/YeaQ/YmgE family stress response membrane protein [Histidinibacterium aquaticum]KAA9005738.1 GlsB/YeaQ/YmgE family stress response membrane protein [Histidinibacterium aquaticum]
MEGFLEGLGIIAIILLIIVGVIAGYLAALVSGGNKGLYVLVGVIAALASPFILALLGVGALAAGGLILLLIVGAIGAAIVLAIVAAIKR